MKLRFATSVLLIALSALTGCSGLPKPPSKADPRIVYVWPVTTCPSQANAPSGPRIAPIIAAIATTLVGDVISGSVNAAASALTTAASADKAGYQVSGINARNYFWVGTIKQTSIGPDGKQTETQANVLQPPQCYVVAYTQPLPDGPAKSWCSDTNGFASMKQTCASGAEILKGLKIREPLYNGTSVVDDGNNSLEDLAVPEFYAEIELDASGFNSVVRPRVVALYYPQSLLQKGSEKPRMLSITVTPSSPVSVTPDQFKSASVAVIFPSITPSKNISSDELKTAMVAWNGVPDAKPFLANIPANSLVALYKTLSNNNTAYVPVTINGAVNEIGDPSVVLAAFAQAFGSVGTDVSKNVMSDVSLNGAPSTMAAAMAKATSDYQIALGGAQQARSALILSCAKNPSTAGDKANAQSLFTNTIGKQNAANLAAEQAGISPLPFPNPNDVYGVVATCWE